MHSRNLPVGSLAALLTRAGSVQQTCPSDGARRWARPQHGSGFGVRRVLLRGEVGTSLESLASCLQKRGG
jgi:hypothetical protein